MKGTQDMKYYHRFMLIGVVFFSNYFLDRITKIMAVHYLTPNRGQISYFLDTVRLQLEYNNGAFLSTGSSWGGILKLLTLIIIPLMICFGAIILCFYKNLGKTQTIIIITIAAGGIGNLQDRIFKNGFVTDFLNFGIGSLRTGILNVADMSITFGIIALILYEFTVSNKESKSLKE